MKSILQTERLRLRQFIADDAEFIVKLVNTPGWIEFIGDRNIKTEDQATVYLEDGPFKSYALNGYGLWMVELKNESGPIGMCGIIKRDYLENPDIGFAFLPEFTGKGYAFEVAIATMKYSKDILKLNTILAITVAQNSSSRKLLEKIGMTFIKLISLPDSGEELMLYST